MKTYILAALVCAAALHGESAQAQQVGARQWFANASEKCLYQFDGRNWIKTRNCQSMRPQVPPHMQQASSGNVDRFKVGNQYCWHALNQQRQWVNIGNCISSQQASQLRPEQLTPRERQNLNNTTAQI